MRARARARARREGAAAAAGYCGFAGTGTRRPVALPARHRHHMQPSLDGLFSSPVPSNRSPFACFRSGGSGEFLPVPGSTGPTVQLLPACCCCCCCCCCCTSQHSPLPRMRQALPSRLLAAHDSTTGTWERWSSDPGPADAAMSPRHLPLLLSMPSLQSTPCAASGYGPLLVRPSVSWSGGAGGGRREERGRKREREKEKKNGRPHLPPSNGDGNVDAARPWRS